MRIITANVNGIRSAYKKGFLDYIAQSQADIICVQELKAQEADLSPEMHGIAPKNADTAASPFTANASPMPCKSA